MKAILFAAAIFAASAAPVLAAEGGHDPFAQSLSGASQTYTWVPGSAPVRPGAAIPAYARLLPGNSSMASPETPNSLPAGFTTQEVARSPAS